MPRRGENIYKRKDGRWEARYIHHYEEGKAKYRYLYGKSYAEVKIRQQEAMAQTEVNGASIVRKLGTFEEITNLWLGTVKGSVKESTYTRYHRIAKIYLIPVLGTEKLIRIDASRINRMIQDMLSTGGQRQQGLSSKTVCDILCVWKAIWHFGSLKGYSCPELNGIHFPQKKMPLVEILPSDTFAKIEKQLLCSEDSFSLGILFTLFTGVRIGELCGLRWGDLDLQNGIAHIRRTVDRIADLNPSSGRKTKVIISEPKTDNAVRSIPLQKFLVEILSMRKERDDCYLLTDTPKWMEPHTCYTRYRRYLEKNGIGDYTFHALRHTFATRCVEQGFDIKSLSEILGHSNVTTTMTYYVHPTMQMKRSQMELLTPDFLSPSESGSGDCHTIQSSQGFSEIRE